MILDTFTAKIHKIYHLGPGRLMSMMTTQTHLHY